MVIAIFIAPTLVINTNLTGYVPLLQLMLVIDHVSILYIYIWKYIWPHSTGNIAFITVTSAKQAVCKAVTDVEITDSSFTCRNDWDTTTIFELLKYKIKASFFPWRFDLLPLHKKWWWMGISVCYIHPCILWKQRVGIWSFFLERDIQVGSRNYGKLPVFSAIWDKWASFNLPHKER